MLGSRLWGVQSTTDGVSLCVLLSRCVCLGSVDGSAGGPDAALRFSVMSLVDFVFLFLKDTNFRCSSAVNRF